MCAYVSASLKLIVHEIFHMFGLKNIKLDKCNSSYDVCFSDCLNRLRCINPTNTKDDGQNWLNFTQTAIDVRPNSFRGQSPSVSS